MIIRKTPEQVDRLEGLGRWMKKHASAIYGTAAGIPAGLFYGPTTLSKDGRELNLFFFDQPLPPIPIPLNPPDPDITLALQPLIDGIYARTRYGEFIDYSALSPFAEPYNWSSQALEMAQNPPSPQPVPRSDVSGPAALPRHGRSGLGWRTYPPPIRQGNRAKDLPLLLLWA